MACWIPIPEIHSTPEWFQWPILLGTWRLPYATLSFIILHRFFIGFRSGLFPGHSRTEILFSFRDSVATFDQDRVVSIPGLSCLDTGAELSRYQGRVVSIPGPSCLNTGAELSRYEGRVVSIPGLSCLNTVKLLRSKCNEGCVWCIYVTVVTCADTMT